MNKLNTVVLSSVDSTNTHARCLIDGGCKLPLMVVAKEQTAGRGRRGRAFFSQGGLYMSLAIETENLGVESLKLTSLVAVATLRVLDRYTNCRPMIKWVNDIFLDGKKLGGILCEAVTNSKTNAVIIGVGLNIGNVAFPKELCDIAVGINIDDVSCEELAGEICKEIITMWESKENYIEEYRSRSLLLGKDIVCYDNNKVYEATALDIDDDAALIVALPDSTTKKLSSGEVTLRIKEAQ